MTLTAADHLIRATGIGSSEIAAVCGVSEYRERGPHHVWMRKRGLLDETDQSEAMELGHLFEPKIAELYSRRTGRLVRPGPGTIRHPAHSWAVASIDYEADDGGITECKLVGMRVAHKWSESDADGVPADVLCQVQWQMEVLDRDLAHVAVVFGGTLHFAAYEIKRDRELGSSLLSRAETFWRDYVLTGTPPPVDHTDSCRDALAAYYPERSKFVDATEQQTAMVKACIALDKQAEEAEELAAVAKNRLRKMIGDSNAAGIRDGSRRDGWGYVSWKKDKRGVATLRFNVKEDRL